MRFCTRILLGCGCLVLLVTAAPGLAQLDSAANLLDDFELAHAVFVSSGAEIKEIKLQVWGQISNGLESVDKLKKKYEAAACGLGLNPAGAALQVEKDGFAGISQLEIKEGEAWQLYMQAVPIPGAPNGGESYAGFLCSTDNPRRARQAYALLNTVFNEAGLKGKSGVTFSGIIQGDLGPQGRVRLADALAAGYAGEYVEGITQDNLASICYYIKQNSNFLPVGGRRINLNIALRYNELENRTYIHVGVPLIYQDY